MRVARYSPAAFHDAAGGLTLLTRSTLAPTGSIAIGCAVYPMALVDVSSSTHVAYAMGGHGGHTRRMR
ncbi:50S ribosomal protein L31 type B [Candidatus Tremblaya princeps]|uniref:50S ribosomal protein L31 type B n=1 Tax=Tremblaya princeps TaxID=189385 RepID=A0A143WNN0_TREPR|nr:50S ribosomal protein L31 type B [Candidatus Tremblaya princeps]